MEPPPHGIERPHTERTTPNVHVERSGMTPHRTPSNSGWQQRKQPILHDSLYCADNPKDSVAMTSEPSDASRLDSLSNSPMISPVDPQPPRYNEHLRSTKDDDDLLLTSLSDNNLRSVKSHAQLAKTAHGVRILAKNLNKATIHLQLRSVMIITKARDNSLVYLTKEMAEWLLTSDSRTNVYVDYHLERSKRFDPQGLLTDIPSAQGRLRFWTKRLIRQNPDLFDLVITLGGDGTVLYASTLFQRVVPPVMSFALGSLGFLTNFKFEDFRSVLAALVKHGVRTNLRMRFTCRVHREDGSLVCEQQVLNELTVDRGPSPWVSMLELYGDGSLLTVAQADGLIIATPTGSTAYSLSAGGSLVHPSVSAISVTPICPHTLSFRPILLPDSMVLKVKVPLRSRATAWASFDGRSRVELLKGHYVSICASPFPFPTVRSSKTEYIDSVSRVLNWNNREEQKSFIHLLSDKNKESYTTYQRRHGSSPDSDLEDEDQLNRNLIYPGDLSPEQEDKEFGKEPARATFTLHGDPGSDAPPRPVPPPPSKLKNEIVAGDDDDFEIDYNDSEIDPPDAYMSPPTAADVAPREVSQKLPRRVVGSLSHIDSTSTIEIDDHDESQNNYFYPSLGEEVRTPTRSPNSSSADLAYANVSSRLDSLRLR